MLLIKRLINYIIIDLLFFLFLYFVEQKKINGKRKKRIVKNIKAFVQTILPITYFTSM